MNPHSTIAARDHAFDSTLGSGLVVERQDIDFFNVADDRVHIAITVHNEGYTQSEPTIMAIEWAEFGAFLPWSPLTTLTVPAIDAGSSHTVVTEVDQRQLGGSMLPPRGKLRAPGGFDDRARREPERSRTVMDWWRTLMTARRTGRSLQGRSAHWVGNLNILIGQRAVERHMANALRIYPGCQNIAIFMVGDRRDHYAFSYVGYPLSECVQTFGGVMDEYRAGVTPDAWVQLRPGSHMFLNIDVPRDLESGELEVHVTQRSTGKTAVVEFSLDAHAEGPGCYTV